MKMNELFCDNFYTREKPKSGINIEHEYKLAMLQQWEHALNTHHKSDMNIYSIADVPIKGGKYFLKKDNIYVNNNTADIIAKETNTWW